MYLKLATVPGRKYDPNHVAKEFTTMKKFKHFTHEEDAFDDIFLQVETFSQVLNMTSLLLTLEDINDSHVYKKKRLFKVPLYLLQIEPIREPTLSVSLEGRSKENFEEETQEKSTHESEHSEPQSQNGGGNTNRESEKDTTRSTKDTTEQALAKKQEMVASTSAQSGKALIIALEQEWEQFNKRIHIDTNPEKHLNCKLPSKPNIMQIQK